MYNEKDEKASLDVETYDLYDPLEAVVRKEGLLVSKVLPEDGQNYISVGSIDVLQGTEIS